MVEKCDLGLACSASEPTIPEAVPNSIVNMARKKVKKLSTPKMYVNLFARQNSK